MIIVDNKILVDWLYQLADDELTLGHRDSEWLGLCPDLEGDIAFSSIAQDEVSHSLFYLELLSSLVGKSPDYLAFSRASSSRKNCILVERPNKDWAYSIVRHYFYDIYDSIRLNSMCTSTYLPLREGAHKMLREEYYHLLYFETCFSKLATGSEEATAKIETAVTQVWPDLTDLVDCGKFQTELYSTGIITDSAEEMSKRFFNEITAICKNFNISVPKNNTQSILNGRMGKHSPYLTKLLATMSEVHRLDPVARW